MQVVSRDPAAWRDDDGPCLVEQVAEVCTDAERIRSQAREIQADARRVMAAGRRIRRDLAEQRERLRAGYLAIRLQRADREWGEG
ncbi:hypothetical protein FXF51_21660 [Nonomuraea sp. PA05]|uniref:hypothetical protein n=1 Tax=Nonomuraea sp. PA05 TaxID=2604466 RepID=UPI0011D873D0|nr:hypothetical protein [Nonomuraea sp. PA05]TYB64331.1 hypothetical protein FXF51_21660 [Nonomuraea sp. PA05]